MVIHVAGLGGHAQQIGVQRADMYAKINELRIAARARQTINEIGTKAQ